MQTYRLDGCLSTLFLTLDFGRGDVSSDVSYELKEIREFCVLTFLDICQIH